MNINEESWKVGCVGNGIIRIEHEQDGQPYIGNVRYSKNPLATKDIAMKRAALIAAAPEMLNTIIELVGNLEEAHQDEIKAKHYGDDPTKCSYCVSIELAKDLLKKVR